MRSISVRVPCSTSNLGAGFDCIGLALNRYLTATLHLNGEPLQIERHGTLAALTDDDDLVVGAMRELSYDPRGHLVVDSDIPVGRGLGSSAAAAVAGIMIAARATDAHLEREVIAARAAYLEGHPDNAVPATFGGLVGAITEVTDSVETVRVHRLRLSDRLCFVYAAPHTLVSTRAARDALPEMVTHAAATRSLARSLALVEGLADADPDLLRIGFADELHVPYRLPMIPGGADALARAVENGAYAATISGSGSGLIAICPRGAETLVRDAMRATFEHATGQAAMAFVLQPDEHGAQYVDV
ncbi:MAG TPA: homoserine kinase [Longimicrobiales bacterium]